MVLNTMRLDIRCRIMCNISSSMLKVRCFAVWYADEKGNFQPETESLEPDADVVDLTTVLLDSEEVASRTLSMEDKE
jgi:exocyst complex component 4